MTYTKKQFLEDVVKEAKALREHATTREISRLNFDNLAPESFTSCIYGQMTGNCNSDRAISLIQKSCPRYFHNPIRDLKNGIPSQKAIAHNVNGEKVEGFGVHRKKLQSDYLAPFTYMSAIESYIVTPTAKPKNLIAYLKGEKNDLKL